MPHQDTVERTKLGKPLERAPAMTDSALDCKPDDVRRQLDKHPVPGPWRDSSLQVRQLQTFCCGVERVELNFHHHMYWLVAAM